MSMRGHSRKTARAPLVLLLALLLALVVAGGKPCVVHAQDPDGSGKDGGRPADKGPTSDADVPDKQHESLSGTSRSPIAAWAQEGEQGGVIGLVKQALTIVAAIVSVYLAVGIAAAFLEGQFAAMTEQPAVKAEILQRITLLALCVAVIAFANVAAYDLGMIILSGGLGDARGAILRVGVYFVDILIGLTVVMMAVGVAFGFVDTQLQVVLGRPVGFSTALSRVTAVVLLGIAGLLTVPISGIVIRALGGG